MNPGTRESLSSLWIYSSFWIGVSLPVSQVMKRMNVQALIVELSWAALIAISIVTAGSFSYWNSASCIDCQGYHNSEQQLHIMCFILRMYYRLPGFKSLLCHLLAM